jgi:hypothetical protein
MELKYAVKLSLTRSISKMQRREFLKLSGAVLGSSLLLFGLPQFVAALPVEVQAQGKRYRGYRQGGDIFVSHDDGNTWQLHTRLGPEYSIDHFTVDYADQVYVRVEYMKYRFYLVLAPNDQQWKTVWHLPR